MREVFLFILFSYNKLCFINFNIIYVTLWFRKKGKSSGKDKENDSDEASVEEQQKTPVISAEEEKKKADTLWAGLTPFKT